MGSLSVKKNASSKLSRLGTRSSSFWLPQNLSNYVNRPAPQGADPHHLPLREVKAGEII